MLAVSPSSLAKDPSRADVVDAVLKSKGLNSIMDIDNEEEPLLNLQAHHELVFIVELCEAQRPSKLGSLKGSHAKYEEEFARLEETLSSLAGDGAISLHKWEPGMGGRVEGMAMSMPTRPPAARPQSAASSRAASRPQSAMSRGGNAQRMQALLGKPERMQPRIGAFEVSFKLINTVSHGTYGPVNLFSKIATGHWPGSGAKLVKRVQESLQDWLKLDMGAGMMFAHVRVCTQSLCYLMSFSCHFPFPSHSMLTVR